MKYLLALLLLLSGCAAIDPKTIELMSSVITPLSGGAVVFNAHRTKAQQVKPDKPVKPKKKSPVPLAGTAVLFKN